jgi:hypothetical protein
MLVNTETDIQALWSDLDSASLCINVSFLLSFKFVVCLLVLTPSPRPENYQTLQVKRQVPEGFYQKNF